MSPDTLQTMLAHYLPHKDGRHPIQRLHAITAAVFNTKTRNITPPLTPTEREDLLGHMLEHAITSIHTYNPQLDTNPHVPLDTRFGRYVAKTTDQRAIDWLRKHRSDPRPTPSGGSRITKTWVSIDGFLDNGSNNTTSADRRNKDHVFNDATDPFAIPDFTDHTLSRLRVQRWQTAAEQAGMTLVDWIAQAADRMLDDQDRIAA